MQPAADSPSRVIYSRLAEYLERVERFVEILNFYLFHRNRSMNRSIRRFVVSPNLSKSLEDFPGWREKGENEKLLKRAAKPSLKRSSLIQACLRWFFTPSADGSQFSTRRTGPFRLPRRSRGVRYPAVSRREISRYRRASLQPNLELTSPRPRDDGGDRRTAAIRALK